MYPVPAEAAGASPLSNMSDKRGRLSRWLEGDGIEIGALHRPLGVTPAAHVTYVDHLSEEDLRKHYPELAALPLTPVGVIGSAEDLSAFEDGSLDFVIANHLLEHLEYPVRGLLEFQRVLRPGGLLYLSLPDQRVTFDRKRALTTVDHLLDEEANSAAEANRRDHYVDWAAHVNDKAPGVEAETNADELMNQHYSIHFHTWRPDTFLEFLIAARQRTPLEFQILQFAAAEFDQDDEFCMLLGKPATDAPRLPPAEVRRTLEPGAKVRQATEAVVVGATPSVRARLARSPIGPPVRVVLRALRQR